MITTFDLSNPDKPTIDKAMGAELDYSERWTAWLALCETTMVSATVTVEAPLVVIDLPFIDDGVVSVRLGGGGPVGKVHRALFSILTADGRRDERSIYLRMKAR